MAIKRSIGKGNRKYKKCLRCDQPITAVLQDDKIYTCPQCGQQHLIDVYPQSITMTVAERPDIRRRHYMGIGHPNMLRNGEKDQL